MSSPSNNPGSEGPSGREEERAVRGVRWQQLSGAVQASRMKAPNAPSGSALKAWGQGV